MNQLGRIIAYDMLLNNSDRMNLYWDIDGNANNLLFKVRSKTHDSLPLEVIRDSNNVVDIAFEDIMMIDTRPTIMDRDNQEAVKNYELMIAIMSKFLHNLIFFVKQESPLECQKVGNEIFNKMNTEFYNYTTCRFNTSQLLSISQSILVCLYDFYVMFPIPTLEELVNSLKRKNVLWEDTYWNESLGKIYMNYFEGVRDTLEKFLLPEEQMIRLLKS